MSDVEKHIPSMGPDRRKDATDVEEDPDNTGSSGEQELAMPQMVVAMGDESDEEEEDSDGDVDDGGAGLGGDGYMLLPNADQEMEYAEIEAMDAEAVDVSAPSTQHQQPELPPHLAKLLPTQPPARDQSTVVSFADSSETLEERRQVMAADDEIREAMAGFPLLGTAVPAWARALGDQEWKDQLAEMIHGREEKRHETAETSKEGKT